MLSDLYEAGFGSFDTSLARAELIPDHRVVARKFMIQMVPVKSVGAELGVFSGLFSSLLSRAPASQITFVDPWWTAFGEFYPDWGRYTDRGRLKTRVAFEAARRRIAASRHAARYVEVGSSYEWLESIKDESLDWVYIDSTHTYEGTKTELDILDRKLRASAWIFGDDWQIDPQHRHHGVAIAVNEFLRRTTFEFMFAGRALQWGLRRGTCRSNSSILWEDALLKKLAATG